MDEPELRNKIINEYVKIFSSKSNKKQIAKIIEQSVYNFCSDFFQKHDKTDNLKKNSLRKLYIAKNRQIYHFFKKKSYISYNNTELLNDLEKLKKIAFLTYDELCPIKWNLFQKDLEILDKKIIYNEKNNIQPTSTFQCPKCKENKCIFSELQVRSCDENTTIFVRCLNCNNSFRG